MDEYMGIIKAFAGNFAPAGWLLCQGQTLNIAQYQALFSLLGTTYGGNGTTTFMLPNLCGRTLVGTGASNQGPIAITEGQQGGEVTHTLTLPEMPVHTHGATFPAGGVSIKVSSGNASQTAATAGASIATPGSGSARGFVATEGFNTSTPDTTLNAASASLTGAVTIVPTGGSGPHNNMQPYLGINYII